MKQWDRRRTEFEQRKFKRELKKGLVKKEDFIQPGNPQFEKIYKYNPFKEAEKKQKELDKQKEIRKSELEKKYHDMYRSGKNSYRKPEELKIIKREVLGK